MTGTVDTLVRRAVGEVHEDHRIGVDAVAVGRITIVVFLALYVAAYVDGQPLAVALGVLVAAAVHRVVWWARYVRLGRAVSTRAALTAIVADVVVIGFAATLSGGVASPAVLMWAVTLSVGSIWVSPRAMIPVLAVVGAYLVGMGAGPLDAGVDPGASPLEYSMFAAFIFAFLTAHGGVATAMQRAGLNELAVAQALARRDPLTGLGNRLCFDERIGPLLADARERGTPVALAILDIDDFKRVNDTRGHAAGDAVIVGFANDIRAEVRQSDLAVRMGGEEFVIVLSDATECAAAATVERIRARFAAGPAGLAFSAGIAADDPTRSDVHAWLEVADVALYAAKRAGKNRTVVADVHAPALVPVAAGLVAV